MSIFTVEFHLTISKDWLRFKNCKSGQSVDRIASPPFSSERHLVSSVKKFEQALRETFRDLQPKPRFFMLARVTVFARGERLSEPEVASISSILERAGCTSIIFDDSSIVADGV